MLHSKRLKSLLLVLLALCCLFSCLSGCANAGAGALDYADKANWAYYQISPEKPADLFLVCPTVDMGRDGNMNMSMEDEKTKGNFVGALNMERGIYEDSLTLYAPYYRQASFPVYSLSQADTEKYMAIAYKDVRAAFIQFTKCTDKDCPFVLAGFSQGSDMVLRLLKEFFNDPAYQDRLIAAYCIGWRITEDDLKACPWLKPAQGEDDIGVIVSFNSEAENVTGSLLVPSGSKTYAINPLNWKTDATPADASLNLGACFTGYDGTISQEKPELTGAYIDPTRGTLKVPEIKPEDYSNKLFPDGVYHLYDYQFFFRNLQQNVGVRVNAYLSK